MNALEARSLRVVLTSDCGQVHIVINSCIAILYLECWYVFVLVFDYCHKVASREQISWNMLVGLRCWTMFSFMVEVLNFLVG